MIITPEEKPGNLEEKADVVVVGSGAGGAVVAAELAEAGLDVAVVEVEGLGAATELVDEVVHASRRAQLLGERRSAADVLSEAEINRAAAVF